MMKDRTIFVACDTSKISRIKKIIKDTKNSKLTIGYKLGFTESRILAIKSQFTKTSYKSSKYDSKTIQYLNILGLDDKATTSDVKSYARIDTSADDTIIGRMIVQARIWCENYISRDIVAKSRTYYVPKTSGIFDIPFAPIASISSVTIDGVATTDYTMEGLDNETIDLDGYADKVKVTYITTGLSDDLLKQAILQLAATYYDNRSEVMDESKSIVGIDAPISVKNILSSYMSMYL